MPKDVTLRDGTVVKNVPDDISKEDFVKKAKDNGIDPSLLQDPPEANKPDFWDGVGRGSADRILGTGKLINEIGIGSAIGLPSNNRINQIGKNIEERNKGGGFSNKVGKILGDPLNYIPIGAVKNAATIGTGIKYLAKLGAKYGAINQATELEGGDTLGQRAKDTVEGAVEGAVTPVALTKGVGLAAKGVNNVMQKYKDTAIAKMSQNLSAIEKDAGSKFDFMRASGTQLNDASNKRLLGNITQTLSKESVDPENHKLTLSALQAAEKDMASGGVDFTKLYALRKKLGQISYKNYGTPDGDLAGKILDDVDAHIDTIAKNGTKDLTKGTPDAAKAAREGIEGWKTARKYDTVKSMFEKSGGDPKQFKKLAADMLANDKRMAGFTPEERKLLEKASKSSTGEGMLTILGKAGIQLSKNGQVSGNLVLPGLELIAGASGFGKYALPTAVAGTGANVARDFINRGKLDAVLKQIKKSAP
jgi:hypothetical protein